MGIYGGLMGSNGIYPLVMTNIANWKDPPILNGKIHYFDWAIFNSFLYVYQRVTPKMMG